MIKADTTVKVKTVALQMFLFFATMMPLTFAQTDDSLLETEAQEFGISKGERSRRDSSPQIQKQDPVLELEYKMIEAEEFPSKLVKKSTSGRVLLLEDPTENRPRPGKILLLKQDQEEIVAIRVLKNYKRRFAGKIVLFFKEPKVGYEYRVLKKIGDRVLEAIRIEEERQKKEGIDQTDEELAKEISPSDAELDRGIPIPEKEKPKEEEKKKEDQEKKQEEKKSLKNLPPPLFDKYGNELSSVEVYEEDPAFEDLMVFEDKPSDLKRHMVSLEYGSVRNVDRVGDPANYSAIGLRYSFVFFDHLLMKKRRMYDLVSAELSAFYYTITAYKYSDDSVSAFPISLFPRYNLVLNENFTVYIYGGLVRTFASQSDGQTIIDPEDLAVLETLSPAVGIGLMIRIGPGWAARIDIGTDVIGVGASLQF